MCFGIGANDAANSWGTSVGSGAISLTQAVLLGGVMEWLGALGLGYGVAKTIKGWFCFLFFVLVFWFFGFLVFWFFGFLVFWFFGFLVFGFSSRRRSSTAGTSKTDDASCWACGYCDSEMSLYMVAMTAALFAAGVFLILVTFTAMPVSTTHAIVGGTVGAAAVGAGCAGAVPGLARSQSDIFSTL
jgi:sodium-dependent phosphate transporter